ncbi:hypothetical protein [Paenibacillus tarimensis]|uniref:hypothetical protein n=1 Tax=Paenibacillus tarimensis TaxID=416012 RepID=UPI001F1997F9|nr:hypothetical protein [Paenibacillus tarimensis]MCF2945167.1 hypothetical protein [Paenibacillus tarimensis]
MDHSADHSCITVNCREGIWWLHDPRKGDFLSLGINHVDPYFLLGPYNKAHFLSVYGQDLINERGEPQTESRAFHAWLRNVEANMRSWNFNTFGYHNCLPRSAVSDHFYYIAQIKVLPGIIEFSDFPDVFSGAFAQEVRSAVQRVCMAHKDRKNLIGYGFMDMPALSLGGSRFPPSQDCLHNRSQRIFAHKLSEKNERYLADPPVHPCVQRYMRLPGHAPGKQAWVHLLQTLYSQPEDAGKVYGVSSSTWEEIAVTTDWPCPPSPDRARRDSSAMLACIYDTYYSLHCREIRRIDPFHLILGDKLNGNLTLPHHLVETVGRHVDAIFYECFSTFGEQAEELEMIHRITGKPILMGDSSFAVISPNQIFSRGTLLPSRELIGKTYYHYLRQLFSLPYVIGWANCGYMEGWEGLNSPCDPFCSMQSGLVDPYERAWPETIGPISQANAASANWHRTGGDCVE